MKSILYTILLTINNLRSKFGKIYSSQKIKTVLRFIFNFLIQTDKSTGMNSIIVISPILNYNNKYTIINY